MYNVKEPYGGSASKAYKVNIVFSGFETQGGIGRAVGQSIGVEVQPGAQKGNFRIWGPRV
jgi:hypothetical protein